MKCPHCETELPSRKCPECHERVPVEGRFCLHCGAEIPVPKATGKRGADAIDFSKRILCSDGTCIGVINEHGVCNECGKPYKGKAA